MDKQYTIADVGTEVTFKCFNCNTVQKARIHEITVFPHPTIIDRPVVGVKCGVCNEDQEPRVVKQ